MLNEQAGLCEWPEIHIGKIDDRFISLPIEVRRSVAMRHQKVILKDDMATYMKLKEENEKTRFNKCNKTQ